MIMITMKVILIENENEELEDLVPEWQPDEDEQEEEEETEEEFDWKKQSSYIQRSFIWQTPSIRIEITVMQPGKKLQQ